MDETLHHQNFKRYFWEKPRYLFMRVVRFTIRLTFTIYEKVKVEKNNVTAKNNNKTINKTIVDKKKIRIVH